MVAVAGLIVLWARSLTPHEQVGPWTAGIAASLAFGLSLRGGDIIKRIVRGTAALWALIYLGFLFLVPMRHQVSPMIGGFVITTTLSATCAYVAVKIRDFVWTKLSAIPPRTGDGEPESMKLRILRRLSKWMEAGVARRSISVWLSSKDARTPSLAPSAG
jgi:hypothetical protein